MANPGVDHFNFGSLLSDTIKVSTIVVVLVLVLLMQSATFEKLVKSVFVAVLIQVCLGGCSLIEDSSRKWTVIEASPGFDSPDVYEKIRMIKQFVKQIAPPPVPDRAELLEELLIQQFGAFQMESMRGMALRANGESEFPLVDLSIEANGFNSLNRWTPGKNPFLDLSVRSKFKYYVSPPINLDHDGVFLRFTW